MADDDTSGATAAQTAAVLHRLLHVVHEVGDHDRELVLDARQLSANLLLGGAALDVDDVEAGVVQGAEELGGDDLVEKLLEHNGGAAGDDGRAAASDGSHSPAGEGPAAFVNDVNATRSLRDARVRAARAVAEGDTGAVNLEGEDAVGQDRETEEKESENRLGTSVIIAKAGQGRIP